MVTIAELLAASLNIEEAQQANDLMMVKQSQISISHLKELINKNFIKHTIKDWYVIIDPRALPFIRASKVKSLRYMNKVA